jgi:cytochrome c-type biogenesis protein CcmH/NrfF
MPEVITFVDRFGTYHPPDRTMEQAWWSAPVTVLIVLASAAAVLCLMPERRRLLTRFAAQFGMSAPRRRRDRSGAVGLRERTR